MRRGAGGFLSSLHPLSLLPLQCQVCAMAAGAGPVPASFSQFHRPHCPLLCTGGAGWSIPGVEARAGWRVPHLQPGGHLVTSGLLCLSTWPDDFPVVGNDLGVGV